MRALIINGLPDGRENLDRWTDAKTSCDRMGWTCDRSPAMFVNMDEYRNTCGDHSKAKKHDKYVRGCMFAHKRAFSEVANGTDRAVILEDDISIPSGAAERVHTFIEDTSDVDVAYIGHCFGTQCMHAFTLTPEAAKKALDTINWCSKVPVDNQLSKMCESKKLNCSYAPNAEVECGTWGQGLIHQKSGGEVRKKKWFR